MPQAIRHPRAMAALRFPILFTGVNKAMVVLGVTPGGSYVEVADDVVRVRLSWIFRADIPRSSIAGVRAYDGPVWGWGAHGWGGRWLVNGSSKNLVELDVDPPAVARVTGVPIRRLRRLRVSVVDRAGLLAALAT